MNKIRSYLGIDTSNYTTSVALCAEDGTVLENFKLLLGVAEGERGLRQSDAVFSHVKNFPVLIGSDHGPGLNIDRWLQQILVAVLGQGGQLPSADTVKGVVLKFQLAAGVEVV